MSEIQKTFKENGKIESETEYEGDNIVSRTYYDDREKPQSIEEYNSDNTLKRKKKFNSWGAPTLTTYDHGVPVLKEECNVYGKPYMTTEYKEGKISVVSGNEGFTRDDAETLSGETYKMFYNEKEQPILQEGYDWKGNVIGKIEYQYDENDNKTSEVLYGRDGEIRRRKEYDDKGELKSISYFSDEGETKYVYKSLGKSSTVCAKYKNGKILKEELSRNGDVISEIKYKDELPIERRTYYEGGRLESVTKYMNGKPFLTREFVDRNELIVTTYDTDGKAKESVTIYEGEVVSLTKFEGGKAHTTKKDEISKVSLEKIKSTLIDYMK